MAGTRRVLVGLVGAVLLTGVLAAPVAAHVTADPDVADAPSFRVAFRIGHGCAGSPTTGVRVRIPDGVQAPVPEEAPGWDVEVVREAGEPDRVTEVAWVGGSLPAEHVEEFVLSGRFTDEAGDVVYFPLVQECEQGEHRWVDVPPSLEEWGDLEEPAPYVRLAFREAGAAAQGACGAVETTPDEGHLHLLGDAQPPAGYASTPPASGWHYRARDRIRLGVAPGGEPLTEPEQVSVLAVGGVVIGYRDLGTAGVEALEGVVEAAGDRPVALTPYGALEPGEVALSAWRRVQRCDGLDLAAVEAFVEAHAAPTPDFTMSAGGEQHDHDAGAPPGDAGPALAAPPGDAGPALAAPVVAGVLLLAGFAAAAWRALRRPGRAGPRVGRRP